MDSEITKGFSLQVLGESYIGNFRRAIYGRRRNMRRRCIDKISGGRDVTRLFSVCVKCKGPFSSDELVNLIGGYNMCVE